MNDYSLNFKPEELERYNAISPHFLATAQCFLSGKAFRALKYAASEPCHLLLRIVNVPDYPSIKVMESFSRHPLSVRKRAIKEAYYQNARNAREVQPLFRDAVNFVAEFGRAAWTFHDVEEKLIDLLIVNYDEVANKGNRMFWRSMYEKGAILEPDEVRVDIVSFLYDIILGQAQLDIGATRSNELKEIMCLESEDAIVIARRIIKLIENPDSAETRQAAKIMVRSYLERKYGVNKGRAKEAINKATGEGVYYQGLHWEKEGEIEEDVLDPDSDNDFIEVDRYTVYKSAISMITQQEDRDAFELAFKHSMGELSDLQYDNEAAKRGLTPRQIRDRLRYMPKKYPLLASIN